MNTSTIKLARVSKGLTQEQWEKNIDRVSFGDVRRLCKILGINIEEVAS